MSSFTRKACRHSRHHRRRFKVLRQAESYEMSFVVTATIPRSDEDPRH